MRKLPGDMKTFLFGIIDAIPVGIYWKDLLGVYLGCNQHALEIIDVTSFTEVVGKTDGELPWKNNKNLPSKTEQRVIETQKSISLEASITIKNKKRIFFSSQMPLLDQKSTIVGVVGILVDITDRKKSEQTLRIAKQLVEESREAKIELLANMSHDVKIPLNWIIHSSEELIKHSKESATQKIATQTIECSHNLLELFNTCIDFSELENAEITLKQEYFHLKELLQHVIELFKPTIMDKHLTFAIDYDDHLPATLLGSKTTIIRVLQNLLSYSIKHTPDGSIRVGVALGEKSSEREAIVKLTIEDTGISIPPGKQQEIFQYSAHPSFTFPNGHDRSISLYLAGRFITAMNGEIYIESGNIKGNKFTVVLPFKVPLLVDEEYQASVKPIELTNITGNEPKHEKLVPADSSLPEINPKKSIRILLVEDNAIASKSTAKLIKSLGHTIDVASNSDEAITLFAPGKYDLIYMDLGLPERTGQETARLFRHQEREASTPPTTILALTVQATAREKAICLEYRMNGIFIKPLSLNQAKQSIEHFVFNKNNVRVEGLTTLDNIKPNANNNSKKIIDLAEGAKLINSDEHTAKNMLRDLIASLPEDRAIMEQAFKKNDISALRNIVHKLHGGLCYVGAPFLREAAKNLELALNGNETNQRTWCYQKLIDEMSAVEKAFRAIDR